MPKNSTIPTVRTDRLFHVTANWETNTKKRLTRDFLICATNKNDAEIIAKNHIPKRIATYKEHIATDMQIRVRDLGISQKNRTYMMSPIIETERPNPNEPSVLEYTSMHFAYLFGLETKTLSTIERPTTEQKLRLASITQIENKTILFLTWASEFLYEKDMDRNVFFEKKLNELTNTTTESNTFIKEKPKSNEKLTNNQNDSAKLSIEQAKIQADLIIQNAKETAEIIIQNAKNTAQIILQQTQFTQDIETKQPDNDTTNQTADKPSEKTPITETESQDVTKSPINDHTNGSVTKTPEKQQTAEQTTEKSINNIEQTSIQTPVTSDMKTNSIDQHLEKNMQLGMQWLEEFLENDTQITLTPNDIYTELDQKSNEEMLMSLTDTIFSFETDITPSNYFVNEIVNNTELEVSARQATKMAIYHSIQITETETLFQTFVKNYINDFLQRMHEIDIGFGDYDEYDETEDNDGENPHYEDFEPNIDI